jgi:hypothetical protein
MSYEITPKISCFAFGGGLIKRFGLIGVLLGTVSEYIHLETS